MRATPSSTATIAFLFATVVASLAPLAGQFDDKRQPAIEGFPGWPAQYEGRQLVALPLTSLEEIFARDFPGRIGRFHDGRRVIIVRWVNAPTRRLHPATDCFRGSGYGVTPIAVRRDAAGRSMSCFRADRELNAMTVCEVIYDDRIGGQSWPDVSAWYWHALFDSNSSSWWSYTVTETIPIRNFVPHGRKAFTL